MNPSTVSRIVVKVSEALTRLAPQFIHMPAPNDIIREKQNFTMFPKVIGIVDGTQIRIQSPGGDDPEVYRNRKSYFSIKHKSCAMQTSNL